MTTEAERRRAHLDAVASARIEGFVPDEAFSADADAFIAGTLSNDEARERSLARAVAAEQASHRAAV